VDFSEALDGATLQLAGFAYPNPSYPGIAPGFVIKGTTLERTAAA